MASADLALSYMLFCFVMGSAVDSGGSRLTRRPSLLLSSSCFARRRLCAANMSNGDIAGGISPAKCCILGDGCAARGDRKPGRDSEEPLGFDDKSMKVGRLIVREKVRDSIVAPRSSQFAEAVRLSAVF